MEVWCESAVLAKLREDDACLSVSTPARHSVRLDNSGLLVFLRDPAHDASLNDAPPSVLSHFTGPLDANDQALLVLPSGTLVAYELAQDDPVDVEIVVGQPLSPKQQTGKYNEPERTSLRVTSGTLRIETYDSLSVGPNRGDGDGHSIEVKPGEYVLSLYRRTVAPAKGKSRGDLIVLTPSAKAAPLASPKALLLLPRPEILDVGDVSATEFRGHVLDTFVGGGAIALSMRREHATKLGLSRGQRLDLTLAAGTRHAVFLGPLAPQDKWSALILGEHLSALRGSSPSPLGAWFAQVRLVEGAPMVERLIVGPIDLQRSADAWDKADASKGAVVVRPLAERAFTADDDAPLLELTVKPEHVAAHVIASARDRVVFGVGAAAISSLGVKAGDELQLRIGDTERRVIWGLAGNAEIIQRRRAFEAPFEVKLSDDPAMSLADKIALRKKQEAEALVRMAATTPLVAWHAPHWDYPELEVMYCVPLARENANLDVGLAVPRRTMAVVRRA
jgi:hypothetical protein